MKPPIIDALRAELRRQADKGPDLVVAVKAIDKPDTMRVVGTVDLYELARAVAER